VQAGGGQGRLFEEEGALFCGVGGHLQVDLEIVVLQELLQVCKLDPGHELIKPNPSILPLQKALSEIGLRVHPLNHFDKALIQIPVHDLSHHLPVGRVRRTIDLLQSQLRKAGILLANCVLIGEEGEVVAGLEEEGLLVGLLGLVGVGGVGLGGWVGGVEFVGLVVHVLQGVRVGAVFVWKYAESSEEESAKTGLVDARLFQPVLLHQQLPLLSTGRLHLVVLDLVFHQYDILLTYRYLS
jgi:hypothetical protein